MKDYFKGVDFPELPGPVEKATTVKPKQRYEEPGAEEALRLEAEEFNRLVMNILNAVRSGESELCRATTLSTALLEVLSRLHQNPSGERICGFLAVVRTDLNVRVSQEIERLLESKHTFARTGIYQFPLLRGMFLGV